MHALTFAVEQFLIGEAELLDERRFEEWIALYDEDAYYWAPVLPEATERGLAQAHYDEDHIQMEARIKRLQQPTAFSEQPPMRVHRLVGNVRILEQHADGTLRVRSKLIAHAYRNRATGGETRTTYAATVEHLLRPSAAGFTIGWKRVDLVDAEAAFSVASVPL